MNRVLLVFRRDYREMRSTAAFRIMVMVAAAITAGASAGISVALRLQPWYGEPEARPVLNVVMGLVSYFLPLIVLTAFIWAFASFSVVKEKVNGVIECLMATPLGPKALLIGKGLAVFVPGYIISVIALGIFLLTVNLSVFLPGWHAFVLPGPAVVLGLVINPLLFFCLLLLTILISLASNPDIAVGPSLITGFGLLMGMPVGLVTGAIDISSWSFVLWYLAATAVAWAVFLYLTRLLKRQNIVLSSKGV